MKYGKYTLGQIEALINILGGEENTDAILDRQLAVELKKAAETLVDKNGRVIPMKGLKAAVRDPDSAVSIRMPHVFSESGKRLVELSNYFYGVPGMTIAEYEDRATELMEQIGADPQIRNLLNGVCLPLVLPRLPSELDYGKHFELYLKPIAEAYQKAFLGRKFVKWSVGILTDRVGVLNGLGQDELMARLCKGTVVGLYFPNPMQGFSIKAAREQMPVLRAKGLILAAGFETAMALVMYPEVMVGNPKVPRYDLAGLYHQHPDCTMYFNLVDDELQLLDYEFIDHADDCASAGLLFIGR